MAPDLKEVLERVSKLGPSIPEGAFAQYVDNANPGAGVEVRDKDGSLVMLVPIDVWRDITKELSAAVASDTNYRLVRLDYRGTDTNLSVTHVDDRGYETVRYLDENHRMLPLPAPKRGGKPRDKAKAKAARQARKKNR